MSSRDAVTIGWIAKTWDEVVMVNLFSGCWQRVVLFKKYNILIMSQKGISPSMLLERVPSLNDKCIRFFFAGKTFKRRNFGNLKKNG